MGFHIVTQISQAANHFVGIRFILERSLFPFVESVGETFYILKRIIFGCTNSINLMYENTN